MVRWNRRSSIVDANWHKKSAHPVIDHATIRHWRRYLEGLEPCHIPNLGPGKDDQRKVGSIELQVGSDKRLKRLSEEHGVVAANILQTAWALVLKRHLGKDSTCFGYHSPSCEDIVEKRTSTHSSPLRNRWPNCNGRMVANLRYKPGRTSDGQSLDMSHAFSQTISSILENSYMLAKDVGLPSSGNRNVS